LPTEHRPRPAARHGRVHRTSRLRWRHRVL